MATPGKNRKRASRKPLGLTALVVVCSALLYGKGPGNWFSGSDTGALAGAEVRRGSLPISVTERGNLTAKNSYSLKCQIEGRSTILKLIDEGTYVQPGDVVAELDASELVQRKVQQEITVQSAKNAFIKAKANLEIQETENESQIARAKQTVEFAKADLRKYIEGDRHQKLQEADETILLAEEDLKIAQDQHEWSQKLEASGFLTRTELERDKLAFNRAEILLEQKKRAKELLIDYEDPKSRAELLGDMEEAERNLRKVGLQATAQIVDYETALSTSERRLELEEEELAKYIDQIEKAIMRAPVAGIVVYGREEGGGHRGGGEPVAEGVEVRQNKEIVSIPGDGPMIAEASIHESVVKQVQVGQRCKITVDALPGREFHGVVTHVALLPDKQSWWANPNLRLYKTDVTVEEEDREMRPGMSCSIEILVDQLDDVVYVPLQAVVHHRDRNLCFVRNGSALEQRPVVVGQHNEKWVEIVSGLEPGEIVLMSPPPGFQLEAGTEDSGAAPMELTPEPGAPGVRGAGHERAASAGDGDARHGGDGADIPGGAPARPSGRSSEGQ